MKTILLVDDEPLMLDLLSLYLSPLGYNCIKKESAADAISYLKQASADLILLDIMMPEIDGLEACREIKKYWDIPIIMLTAMSEKADIVNGLRNGADDYISKPFDEEELTARIEAVLRRKNNDSGKLLFNGLSLNLDAIQLHYFETEIALTPKEFAMMKLFLYNPDRVFTREHLLTSIWGYAASTEDRTIDSHVRNLREKLRKAGFPADDHLLTVWGTGYKWAGKHKG
ncbi:response regulator transcription factor [Bacillaceae bacterium Marseille-Q3522]|nr:response regulator transcription factor [Bacillaceae bacterium Marseille-Q3522]